MLDYKISWLPLEAWLYEFLLNLLNIPDEILIYLKDLHKRPLMDI